MSSEKLVEALADLKEEKALKLVKEKLDAGEEPLKILEICRKAVEIVGKRFEDAEYFLPDLIMAGEILRRISEITKLDIEKAGEVKYLAKVVIGTVQGDIHNIGKDIVTFMLDANGFDVYDIGVDAPPQKFVEKIEEVKPEIVALSGFLTLAYDSMKKTVEAIEAAGQRNQIKIIIGGGHIDENVRRYTGADAYATSAAKGVRICKKWMEI
ncbi:cobalamin-dependent protein [Candidatus Bathyarchaeota archaeon]|nr:cobalamin-dependent protein [Candidatus Bathyarchaeota archaeon]